MPRWFSDTPGRSAVVDAEEVDGGRRLDGDVVGHALLARRVHQDGAGAVPVPVRGQTRSVNACSLSLLSRTQYFGSFSGSIGNPREEGIVSQVPLSPGAQPSG